MASLLPRRRPPFHQGQCLGTAVTPSPPIRAELNHRSSIILPIRKMILPEEVINKPIPTLSDRQFVVAKSDLTKAEQKVQQELFWYREELFKSIRGEWQEVRFISCTHFPSLLTFSIDGRHSLGHTLPPRPTHDHAYARYGTPRSCQG